MTREQARVGMRVATPVGMATIQSLHNVEAIVLCDDGKRWGFGYSRMEPIIIEFPNPTVDKSHFPHKCPRCGVIAYVGLKTVEHYTGGNCE